MFWDVFWGMIHDFMAWWLWCLYERARTRTGHQLGGDGLGNGEGTTKRVGVDFTVVCGCCTFVQKDSKIEEEEERIHTSCILPFLTIIFSLFISPRGFFIYI